MCDQYFSDCEWRSLLWEVESSAAMFVGNGAWELKWDVSGVNTIVQLLNYNIAGFECEMRFHC